MGEGVNYNWDDSSNQNALDGDSGCGGEKTYSLSSCPDFCPAVFSCASATKHMEEACSGAITHNGHKQQPTKIAHAIEKQILDSFQQVGHDLEQDFAPLQ